MDLQKEQAKLTKLKAVDGVGTEAAQGNVVLQFSDVEKSREFLPLPYQIRAIQSKIIDLQETLASDTEKYAFYLQVLALDDRLLSRIEESLLTYYTVPQFLAFLGEQLQECKEQALSDHLKSYIRKTENLVLVNTRAGEKPVVHPMSQEVAKNSVLAFVLFLMVAMFAAVLSEYRHQRHDPGSGVQVPARRSDGGTILNRAFAAGGPCYDAQQTQSRLRTQPPGHQQLPVAIHRAVRQLPGAADPDSLPDPGPGPSARYGLVELARAVTVYFLILTDYGFSLSATREISIRPGRSAEGVRGLLLGPDAPEAAAGARQRRDPVGGRVRRPQAPGRLAGVLPCLSGA